MDHNQIPVHHNETDNNLDVLFCLVVVVIFITIYLFIFK